MKTKKGGQKPETPQSGGLPITSVSEGKEGLKLLLSPHTSFRDKDQPGQYSEAGVVVKTESLDNCLTGPQVHCRNVFFLIVCLGAGACHAPTG